MRIVESWSEAHIESSSLPRCQKDDKCIEIRARVNEKANKFTWTAVDRVPLWDVCHQLWMARNTDTTQSRSAFDGRGGRDNWTDLCSLSNYYVLSRSSAPTREYRLNECICEERVRRRVLSCLAEAEERGHHHQPEEIARQIRAIQVYCPPDCSLNLPAFQLARFTHWIRFTFYENNRFVF